MNQTQKIKRENNLGAYANKLLPTLTRTVLDLKLEADDNQFVENGIPRDWLAKRVGISKSWLAALDYSGRGPTERYIGFDYKVYYPIWAATEFILRRESKKTVRDIFYYSHGRFHGLNWLAIDQFAFSIILDWYKGTKVVVYRMAKDQTIGPGYVIAVNAQKCPERRTGGEYTKEELQLKRFYNKYTPECVSENSTLMDRFHLGTSAMSTWMLLLLEPDETMEDYNEDERLTVGEGWQLYPRIWNR